MSMPRELPLCTVDEYLKMERAAFERHEYLDGQILAMAGESIPHGYVTQNLSGVFFNQLKGTPCASFSKDIKVRTGPTPLKGKSKSGMFSYPDLLVVCGELEFHDSYRDVIANPRVIVEVLSDSTESFNRGEKFERYKKWNPTFTDYVLVAQKEAKIEHFHREPDGTWTKETVTGLDKVLVLTSIHCTLPLADVYDRVDFAKE